MADVIWPSYKAGKHLCVCRSSEEKEKRGQIRGKLEKKIEAEMEAVLKRLSRGITPQRSTGLVISDIHKMTLVFVLCVRTKTTFHTCGHTVLHRAAQRKKIITGFYNRLAGRCCFPFCSISLSIKEPIWILFNKQC